MSSRPTRESGGGVLSFTFLDVLTCTMGSLVLLVVILGQKAANTRLEDALRNGPRKPGDAPIEATAQGGSSTNAQPVPLLAEKTTSVDPDIAKAAAELAALKQQEAQLAALKAKAGERLEDERDRVSHLEEHERRLEQELAKLHITLQRLAEAEKEQSIDQESADRDLQRLTELVKEKEEQLEKLKDEPHTNKSYAIVPYKGANGTYRQPVYIECTKDAVTIQPEGIVLTAIDFDGPIRSGNPLAAAIRAAREELNARAAAAGKTDLPDPYPLLIVRPDGAQAYNAALSAISAWDADFGYEFVDADWKLEYPPPDPQLSQAMSHAVSQARERQAMLAKVAPRRYGSRLTASSRGNGGGGGGGSGDGGGFETIAQSSADGDRIGERGGDGFMNTGGTGSDAFSGVPGSAAGNPFNGKNGGGAAGGGGAGGAAGNFADQFQPAGGTAAAQTASVQSSQGGGGGGGGSGAAGSGGGNGSSTGSATSSNATAATGAQASGQSGGHPNGTPGGASGGGAEGGAPGGQAASGSLTPTSLAGGGGSPSAGSSNSTESSSSAGSAAAGGEPASSTTEGARTVSINADPHRQNSANIPAPSAAESRGENWANKAASRQASAITRPIQVVVRPDQIDVLPEQDTGAASTEPTVVSFHQPTDRMLDGLAGIVQQHIKDWGLAGQNMYWRPMLVLQVAPGADQHAARLTELLRDSGVDVRLQQIATRTDEEPADVRR